MTFCSKCGAQLNDNAKFCPACGATTGAQQQATYQQPQQPQQPPVNQNSAYNQYTGNNGGNYGAPVNSSSSDDTIMGVLAYLGILVLIPIFAAKESRFARYHANQGVTLCIIAVAWVVILAILNVIFIALYVPGILTVLNIIGWLLSLGFLALAIIGIINVCNKQMKPLPVIGELLHIIK